LKQRKDNTSGRVIQDETACRGDILVLCFTAFNIMLWVIP